MLSCNLVTKKITNSLEGCLSTESVIDMGLCWCCIQRFGFLLTSQCIVSVGLGGGERCFLHFVSDELLLLRILRSVGYHYCHHESK